MDFKIYPYQEARKTQSYGNQITVLPNLEWYYCEHSSDQYFYQAKHKGILINIRMNKDEKWIGLLQEGVSVYLFPTDPQFTVSQVLVDIEDDLLHTKEKDRVWKTYQVK